MSDELLEILGIWSDSDDSEYLEEANAKGIDNFIKVLFGHLLKFIYQKKYQSLSWIRSIKNSNKAINSILTNTNIYNYITDTVLDKIYKAAIIQYANGEAHLDMDPNSPRPTDWDRDFIRDRNRIISLLMQNARDDKIRSNIEYVFRE